ncbi:MAG: (d)CMP kinase [Ignavibacteriaceae bacterium]|nr:(d)CMP kinase [Ignavibacteriaceae bacterium]
MSKRLIVAIDGPAGSGKSTSAKLVAQKLGYLYIDTGAMYRTVTYLAINNNVLKNKHAIINLAMNSNIVLKFIDGVTHVSVDGNDISEHIRLPEVNLNVSDISTIEEVRKILVDKQRKLAEENCGVVMEGRDIGTVVFPDANVKIFLIASIDERARRRAKEYDEKGVTITLEEVKANLQQRDKIDSTRDVSPLTKAPDAIEVDTSNVSIQQQVDLILGHVKQAAKKEGIELGNL